MGMLLGLAGVSGVGKSHFADLIAEQPGFVRGKVLTTRAPRRQEAGGKVYVSEQEFDRLRQAGELAFEMEILGHHYAYLKSDLKLPEHVVVEIPYSVVAKLKQLCPQLCTIYIFPEDPEQAKASIRARQLPAEAEAARLAEIEQQIQRMTTDNALRETFDQIVYNHYNQATEQEILTLAQSLVAA